MIEYKYGEGEVKALAKKAGEAQAARLELDRHWQKDMAMMEYQFKLAAEQRARAWELEKMEIASRNDFALQEQQRVERDNQWATIKKKIDETTIWNPQQKEELLATNYMKIYGGVAPEPLSEYQRASLGLQEARLGLQEREQTQNEAAREKFISDINELNVPEETKEMLRLQLEGKDVGVSIPGSMITGTLPEEANIPKRMSPNELVSATKFLAGFQENAPGNRIKQWWKPWFLEGKETLELAKLDNDGNFEREATQAEKIAYEEIKTRLATGLKFGGEQPIQPTTVNQTNSKVGDIVTRGGKQYKITDYDTDGTPLVEPL